MGRSPCCEKVGLKKGPWTPEEDQKLLAYIDEHGHGSWRALPAKAGEPEKPEFRPLRPDIKRGKFSVQEEQTIIQLHALLGNRWSAIATHLPKRTDNEIKNYWNTHLKKRLTKMGIDPVTHKATNGALGGTADDHSTKAAASLNHMAQWESARLEAEARLARESKLRAVTSAQATLHTQPPNAAATTPPCLDVLRAWHGARIDLGSPTSTLTFTESNSSMPPLSRTTGTEISESNSTMWRPRSDELESEDSEWKFLGKQPMQTLDGKEMAEDFIGGEEPWFTGLTGISDGFTGMLLDTSNVHDTSECCGESNNAQAENSSQVAGDEENKNYWNGILGMANSVSPSHPPPVF